MPIFPVVGIKIFTNRSTSAAGGSVTFTINDFPTGVPTTFVAQMRSDIFNNGTYLNTVRMYRGTTSGADATPA